MSIAAAIVYVIVGTNQLAAFLVFAWLSFLGAILFFRAFSLTFPGADARRYAYLMFFLPSLLFWTADVSKEAIMTVSLGLVSYGTAKILARRSGGYTLLIMGVAVGILIRPNELLFSWPDYGGHDGVVQRRTSGRREPRVLSLLVFGALLVLSAFLTVHYWAIRAGRSLCNRPTPTTRATGAAAAFPTRRVRSATPVTSTRSCSILCPLSFHGFAGTHRRRARHCDRG